MLLLVLGKLVLGIEMVVIVSEAEMEALDKGKEEEGEKEENAEVGESKVEEEGEGYQPRELFLVSIF